MPLESMLPYIRLSDRMPQAVSRLLASMPMLKPVVPDPGVRFQLVHEDDVADAFAAAVLRQGDAGPARPRRQRHDHGLGHRRRARLVLAAASRHHLAAAAEAVERMPMLPEWASWIHAVRKPLLVKSDRARKELGWRPKHTTRATMRELVDAYREEQRAR